ncbi:MAG: hypothetical protein JNM46_08105 [Anaerolineales bacterium]|nr:hypothetical protein [Anaerolineales bacterium]
MLEKPSESVYLGVAGVKFSIIPSVIPNDFASFPGEEINPDSEWWHLVNIFGYYQIGEFYYLRILPGWGT